MILAAFLRCSQHPALERRIVEHPILEPHVAAWRERRGISRKGKVVALLLFPALLLPAIAGVIGSLWIAS